MNLTSEQREQLAKVMAGIFGPVPYDQDVQLATQLVPLIEYWIHKAQIKAWDEGFDAGELDVLNHERMDDWESECIHNPYRRYE